MFHIDFYLDFTFIKTSDLLTYIAILLAYLAYSYSIENNFNSWKSLLDSFHEDIKFYGNWFGTEYFADKYENKYSFCPSNNIFPLGTESLSEILRRGIGQEFKVSKKFKNYLPIFYERIIAFNSLLDHIKKISTADPIKSEKLIDMLNEIGLKNDRISFKEFKDSIYNQKKIEEVFYLAENLRRYNKMLHVKLIGNKSMGMLHFLYSKIEKEFKSIYIGLDKPWFLRYKVVIIPSSVIIFLFIEIIGKIYLN